MVFWDFFRRRPPIRDAAALGDFIDENAAFLMQKGIYEYARARAGHYAKVLFSDTGFIAAADASRWRAYPLGLAMVGEIAEGILRPHVRGDRRAHIDAFARLVLSVFDRYPIPTMLDEATWRDARATLALRLDQLGLHPPKWAKDVPENFARAYFDVMPIHEKLRARDFPTTRNYLRVSVVNIHEELVRRLDPQATLASLQADLPAGAEASP